MGGRGSSGSRGSGSKLQLADWEERSFLNGDLARGGLLHVYENYMKDKGFTPEEIQEVRDLLQKHGGNSAQQAVADSRIVQELESGSRLGKALEANIDFEEKLYDMWIKHQKQQEEPWRRRVYEGEKSIFRAGKRKTGVEAWTVKEEGADMGRGSIGIDHRSSIEALKREGYRILGGIGLAMGAPGEGEITFVKYRRKR